MTKKIIIAAAAIISFMAIVVAVSKQAPDDTIRIGAIFSLTGNGAAYGEPAHDGLILAVSEINNAGGVNGKKVEVVYEDSQFDPKIAVNAYQKLHAGGIKYFFTNGSAVSLAVEKQLSVDETQIEVAATTPLFSDGKANTCRITLTAPVAGGALADFAATKIKAATVATLTLNDDYGKAMTEAVSQGAAAHGIKVLATESFDKDATDFRTQITKIKALRPDALLLVPAAGQAESILKQLRELGWSGAILSDNFTIVNNNLTHLDLAEGIYFSDYEWNSATSTTDSSAATAFKSAFLARFGHHPSVVAANTYDSMMMFADSMKNGASLVSTKDFNGVTGTVSLNSDCESSRSVRIEQVRGGKFIQVSN